MSWNAKHPDGMQDWQKRFIAFGRARAAVCTEARAQTWPQNGQRSLSGRASGPNKSEIISEVDFINIIQYDQNNSKQSKIKGPDNPTCEVLCVFQLRMSLV